MSKVESIKAEEIKEMVPVVNAGSTAVAINDLIPDYLRGYIGDNRGNDNVSVDDVTLPRLEIVQSLSQARDKDSTEYIPGSEEGLLYNSLTRQLYGQSIYIIPIAFKKEYLLWQSLAKGGGFGGAYDTEAQALANIETLDNPESWEAVLTHQHICLRYDPETEIADEVVISMARSKLKTSRRLNSLIRMVGGDMPRFVRMYKLAGQKVTNKQGQAYYNYAVDPVPAPLCWTPSGLISRIEKIYEMTQSGFMKIDREYTTIDMEKFANSQPGTDDFDLESEI